MSSTSYFRSSRLAERRFPTSSDPNAPIDSLIDVQTVQTVKYSNKLKPDIIKDKKQAEFSFALNEKPQTATFGTQNTDTCDSQASSEAIENPVTEYFEEESSACAHVLQVLEDNDDMFSVRRDSSPKSEFKTKEAEKIYQKEMEKFLASKQRKHRERSPQGFQTSTTPKSKSPVSSNSHQKLKELSRQFRNQRGNMTQSVAENPKVKSRAQPKSAYDSVLSKSQSVQQIDKKADAKQTSQKSFLLKSSSNPFQKKKPSKHSSSKKKEVQSRNVATKQVELVQSTQESQQSSTTNNTVDSSFQESSIIRQRRSRRDRGHSFIPSSCIEITPQRHQKHIESEEPTPELRVPTPERQLNQVLDQSKKDDSIMEGPMFSTLECKPFINDDIINTIKTPPCEKASVLQSPVMQKRNPSSKRTCSYAERRESSEKKKDQFSQNMEEKGTLRDIGFKLSLLKILKTKKQNKLKEIQEEIRIKAQSGKFDLQLIRKLENQAAITIQNRFKEYQKHNQIQIRTLVQGQNRAIQTQITPEDQFKMKMSQLSCSSKWQTHMTFLLVLMMAKLAAKQKQRQ